MNITALDLSLTATGWANKNTFGVSYGLIEPPKHVLPAKKRGTTPDRFARLLWLRERVDDLLVAASYRDHEATQLVVIENYSFGSKAGREYAGEFGGIVRLLLLERQIPWVEIAPSKLKKFATGKGQLKDSKIHMVLEAHKRLGYTGTNDDAADALWLLHMALVHYKLCDLQLPKLNLEALKEVEWPKIQ